MDWYLGVLRNYVGFSGRARRKEYWMFVLFNFIVSCVLSLLDNLLGLNYGLEGRYGVLVTLYNLAVFLPSLAVVVRRLHDTDRSGWLTLLAFIPLIGAIILIVWFCHDGTPGPNKYGASPKYPDNAGYNAHYGAGQDVPNSEPAAPAQANFCSQCGAALQPDAGFCSECGFQVK